MILTVPVMTPKLSSYWLYLVTSTTYNLAVNLVDSMKVEIIGKPKHTPLWQVKHLIFGAYSTPRAVKKGFFCMPK